MITPENVLIERERRESENNKKLIDEVNRKAANELRKKNAAKSFVDNQKSRIDECIISDSVYQYNNIGDSNYIDYFEEILDEIKLRYKAFRITTEKKMEEWVDTSYVKISVKRTK